MTTVLAYGDGERVWMAADSMTNVYERPVLGAKKITRRAVEVNEPFKGASTEDALIGASGDIGILGIAAAVQLPNFSTAETLDDWAARVAKKLTQQAIERGFVDDGRLSSSVLLGFRGRVWTIVHHYAVAHSDGIGAIGSGEGPAIGAFDALMDTSIQELLGVRLSSPRLLIRTALDVAINRDQFSGGEIQVEQA